jgi:hypothetical protein
MFRRVFESLILPILIDPKKPFTKLHPTQAGFRKGYSTLTQAAICHHALSTKSIQYAIFLDFKAAYDVTTVNHVMSSLQRRNIPIHLQHLIHSLMFQNGSFQLVVNGQLSHVIRRDCGLSQGSPLSPIVFDMFIDPLNDKLNYEHPTTIPQSLFFADDGLLLSRSEEEARRQLSIAEKWAIDNGMTYNVLKCGVISTAPTVGKTPFILFGTEIPLVSHYKYLGFLVTANGIDFHEHIRIQTESAASFLKFIQVQCSEWSPYTRYIIYTTFLRPKLEYGAPLIYAFKEYTKTNHLLTPIQKIQDEAIAWVFNANVNKIRVLEGIVGALTVERRFSHLRCSFQLHLDHTTECNPIRTLISLSNSSQYIFTLRTDKLYEQFKSNSVLSSTHFELKNGMSDFLRSQRSRIILQSKSILVNYISKDARTDGLIDRVFTAPIQYQRLFLSWRRGTLFLNKKCICGERWHRGHISCLTKVTLTFKHRMEFIKYQEKHSKNFCELDYLLNIQRWNFAFDVIKSWQKDLDGVNAIKD